MKKKTNMTCCEKCQIFWTCETKWYRGERGEENICCPVCNYFRECFDKIKTLRKDLEKTKKRAMQKK